jgi:osmoprotectant transport system ATP-binding protein
LIVLKHVNKSFDAGSTYAVRDLSLTVAEGETIALVGASGCGKTTSLKMINRLLEPTSGTIEVGGRDVLELDPVELRRSIGYVFQGIGLFPHMTVLHNTEIVPRLLGWRPEKRRERARELLELVGLHPDTYGERLPNELSGGQQQRVGVARALAADPAYLLMDEPFGALDTVTRDTLQQEMLEIKKRFGKTIVFVTHDIFEAFTLGDRVAVICQGRLEQVGTKEELVRTPATEEVRALIERPAAQAASFAEVL